MQLTDSVAKRRNKVLRVCEVRHKERAAASAAALFFFPPKSWLLLSATQAPARIPCGKLCMLDVALLRFHRAPRSLAKGHRSYARAQKLAAYSRIQWFSCIRIFTVACCLARNQLLFFPPRPLPKKYREHRDAITFMVSNNHTIRNILESYVLESTTETLQLIHCSFFFILSCNAFIIIFLLLVQLSNFPSRNKITYFFFETSENVSANRK